MGKILLDLAHMLRGLGCHVHKELELTTHVRQHPTGYFNPLLSYLQIYTPIEQNVHHSEENDRHPPMMLWTMTA